MFRNLQVSTRLTLLIGISTLALLVASITSIVQIGLVADSLDKVGAFYLPSIINLTSLRNAMNTIAIDAKSHIISVDEDEMASLERHINEQESLVTLYFERTAPYMLNGDISRLEQIKSGWNQYIELMNRALEASGVNNEIEAQRISNEEAGPQFTIVHRLINELIDDHSTEAELEREQASVLATQTAPLVMVSLTVIILITMIWFGRWLMRSIIQPLTQLKEGVQRVGAGELTHRIDNNSPDEIGVVASAFNTMVDNLQRMVLADSIREYLEKTIRTYNQFVNQVADGDLTGRLTLSNEEVELDIAGEVDKLGTNLNRMVENLSEMAIQVRDVASGVAAAAAEILAASTQQIASATEQDAAVTQTMATVDEVRITVKQTAERAQSVAETSHESLEVSKGGQKAVVDTIDGMRNIRQRVENIAENILMLSERTQQIGEIIETVNEIAGQSKLLALNASIEAARAGEEGKGFAVVAMEVRQLAEQSRAATARIQDILNQILQATNTAVMVTEEGSKGTENGMKLVERAGNAIQELSVTLGSAAQAATQIAASTHQQINGMDQLAMAMSSIKQATVQTASSTRQAERSAQDLNQMASQMQKVVQRYRLAR